MTYKDLLILLTKLASLLLTDKEAIKLYKKTIVTIFDETHPNFLFIQKIIYSLNNYLSIVNKTKLTEDFSNYIQFLLMFCDLLKNISLEQTYNSETFVNKLAEDNELTIKNNINYNIDLNHELNNITNEISNLLLTIKQLNSKLFIEEIRTETLTKETKKLKNQLSSISKKKKEPKIKK